jgi:hypothetical protein
MFEPLRIALVAEGPTDGVVITSALKSILQERSFVLQQICPEGSTSFGEIGSGWVGVYRWCHQSRSRGGGLLRNDEILFQNYDLLVLHLDADVAGATYDHGSIAPQVSDGALPCEHECPPASDTTDALRAVLLSWCGEEAPPEKVVICMPSKSTEAWVVAALFPDDLAMAHGIECYRDPDMRLGQQRKGKRIRKGRADYEKKAEERQQAWPRLASPGALGEAYRFESEFSQALLGVEQVGG